MRKKKLDKIKEFEQELNFIKIRNIREFAEKAIETLPDYFFEIPASSTGKYHPKYSLDNGGLMRHTRAAVRIAIELLRLDWWKFTPDEEDLMISALMLHDGWKSGIIQEQYSKKDHPQIAVFALKKYSDNFLTSISQEQLNLVFNCINFHMGQWLQPGPKTKYEKFVHLCDYIVSRKCLEMNFDVPIIRE